MGKEYTREEVSQHKTADNLWIIIGGSVYDVSKFLEEHPGGEEVLLEKAGADATQDFIDVGHSSDAKKTLKQYKIGTLAKDKK